MLLFNGKIPGVYVGLTILDDYDKRPLYFLLRNIPHRIHVWYISHTIQSYGIYANKTGVY